MTQFVAIISRCWFSNHCGGILIFLFVRCCSLANTIAAHSLWYAHCYLHELQSILDISSPESILVFLHVGNNWGQW